jgi:hypothetical protein
MTKTQQCVKSAVASGFRVTRDGKHVFGATGVELKQQLKGRDGRKYYAVSVHVEGSKKKKMPVHVHRLVAYLKFGEPALTATCVRHLNDDPLDNAWDNIVLGDRRSHALDRPKVDRVLHAQKAGRTNSRPDAFWEKVEAEYAAGASYKQLAEKYELSKGTLSFRLSKTGKRTVLK